MIGVKGRPCHYVKDVTCPGQDCGRCPKWRDFQARYLQDKIRSMD